MIQLTTEAWHPVAVQDYDFSLGLVWFPTILRSEYDAILVGRESGGILTAQRRRKDGRFELVAKLRRGG